MILPEIDVLVNDKPVEYTAEYCGVLFKHPDRHISIFILGGTLPTDVVQVTYYQHGQSKAVHQTHGGPKRIKVPTHDQMIATE